MMRKENKINRNRTNLLLVVLCMMLAATLVACKKPSENDSPNTSAVVSEVSSTSEVSEPFSEESSFEVVTSEEPSEVVLEEIEYTNFSSYDELFEYLKKFNETTIVNYDFSEGTPQVIIPNGEKCTLEDASAVIVISINNNIIDVKPNVNYIFTREMADNKWMVFIDAVATDLEVSFTVVYEDGTEEDFIIYVTEES